VHAHPYEWDYYLGNAYACRTGQRGFRTGMDALSAEDEADRIPGASAPRHASNASQGRPTGKLVFGYRRHLPTNGGRARSQEPDPNSPSSFRRRRALPRRREHQSDRERLDRRGIQRRAAVTTAGSWPYPGACWTTRLRTAAARGTGPCRRRPASLPAATGRTETFERARMRSSTTFSFDHAKPPEWTAAVGHRAVLRVRACR